MDQEIVIDSRERSGQARSLIQVACVAGLVAAAAHAAVVREHLAHWWGYGTFFAVAAVAQALAAVALYRRPSRRLLLAVVIGNLGLILLYVLSRTLGTSFVGPHAGHAEPIGLLDLTANSAEGIQFAIVLWMLRHSEQVVRRADRGRRLALVALLAVAAIAVAVPGAPAHVKNPANSVEILASNQMPDVPTPHEMPTEEPPPPPPVASNPLVDEPPPPCTPRVTGDDVNAIVSGAVVYPHDGDLWLAAPPDGKVRRLTTDAGDCWENAATFRDRDTITFSADEAIYNLELRSGRLKRLVDVPGSAAALAWNPAGTKVAYINWGSFESPPTLRIFTPNTGDIDVVRSFPVAEGRCGGMADETSVAWSPDGTSLLFVATMLDYTEDTMFVMDLQGKNLVAPRFGTHARWTHEANNILYRSYGEPGRWYSLDLDTARSTGVDMRAQTHHAALSPDGRYMAYSDEASNPTTYLFDIVKGTERVLARGYVVPVWLSSDEIALTKATACEDCMHGMWVEGETAGFDLSGRRTRSLSMTTTMTAAALLPSEQPPTPPPSPPPAPPTPSPSPSPSPSETPNPVASPTDPPSASPEPSPSPTS